MSGRARVRIVERAGRVHAGGASFCWAVAPPGDEGLDRALLEAAAEQAALHKADSLVVIRKGRVVLERYWNEKSRTDLQQTYSGTKSLFALLLGRAVERGDLSGLEQPLRELLPELREAQAQLTFRNVLAMQSGMENSMQIELVGRSGKTQLEIALERKIIAPPFEHYHYNNAAYRLLFSALERATGLDLETLSEVELFEPLSFEGACWTRLYAVPESGAAEERFTGYQSVRMTPRDFAKSAQIILDDGLWRGERFLPAAFVRALVQAPNPRVNPSFGLFHHLNAGSFHRGYAIPDRVDRKLVPGAPDDLFLQYGAGGQIVAGIPSLRLVVVRTGRADGSSIYDADNDIAQLLGLIADSAA